MSRLEEIKNEVVKEFGYKDFITYERLMIDSYDFDNTIIIEKIAKSYATECIKAYLKKLSYNTEIFAYEDYCFSYIDTKILESDDNIVLL